MPNVHARWRMRRFAVRVMRCMHFGKHACEYVACARQMVGDDQRSVRGPSTTALQIQCECIYANNRGRYENFYSTTAMRFLVPFPLSQRPEPAFCLEWETAGPCGYEHDDVNVGEFPQSNDLFEHRRVRSGRRKIQSEGMKAPSSSVVLSISLRCLTCNLGREPTKGRDICPLSLEVQEQKLLRYQSRARPGHAFWQRGLTVAYRSSSGLSGQSMQPTHYSRSMCPGYVQMSARSAEWRRLALGMKCSSSCFSTMVQYHA